MAFSMLPVLDLFAIKKYVRSYKHMKIWFQQKYFSEGSCDTGDGSTDAQYSVEI